MYFQEIFYERLDYYTIIGIMCGLAIYNSITVYLPFPLTLYKKLLERFVALSPPLALAPAPAPTLALTPTP